MCVCVFPCFPQQNGHNSWGLRSIHPRSPRSSVESVLCVTESEDCKQPDIQGLRMAPQSPLKCKLASEKSWMNAG